MGVAFGSPDAQRSHRLLVQRGLNPQPVRQLTREFELPTGVEYLCFALCFLDHQDIPGLLSVVICQHLTPELLRRPEWLVHANGAVGVRAITGLVRDHHAASSRYRQLLEDDFVEVTDDRIVLRFGPRQRIELLADLPANMPRESRPSTAEFANGMLFSVTLEVQSISRTRDYLSAARVPWQGMSHGIRVPPHAACGLWLEFTE
jgi:hypothetical protein